MTTFMYGKPALNQSDFNRLNNEYHNDTVPFVWEADFNGNNRVDPDELVFKDFATKLKYVRFNKFTNNFKSFYLNLVELKRREVVEASLSNAIEVHVDVDFSDVSAQEKEMIKHLLKVADLINDLYRTQLGTRQYDAEIEAIKDVHPASYELAKRNHGPFCEEPRTADDPFCNALPSFPKQHLGVYPSNMLIDESFCSILEGEIADPMTVVIEGVRFPFEPKYYHDIYQTQMENIAIELEAAAQCLNTVEDEQLLKKYLLATAASFRTGDWLESDRIWVSMNNTNSKYALRVAPDETYWEDCQKKAGFELWFGRINTGAAKIIESFDSAKYSFENEFANLTPYYQARDINLDVPSFVDMAIMAGDCDYPRGGILGQALPNYTYQEVGFRQNIFLGINKDKYSQQFYTERAHKYLHPDTRAYILENPEIRAVNTAGHELTHCLGPDPRNQIIDPITKEPIFEVDEKGNPVPVKITDAIGSDNAKRIEELKAEAGGMYLVGCFLEQGKITQEQAYQRYTDELMWTINQFRKGLYGEDKAYPQMAAAQLYWHIKTGAIEIINNQFKINFELYHDSLTTLMKKVIECKMTGSQDIYDELFEPIQEGNIGYTTLKYDKFYNELKEVSDRSYVYTPTGLD